MKVGGWCCYVVGRPPAKFHRIWSPFDAPTNNCCRLIRQTFSVSRKRRRASLSSLLSAQGFPHSPLPLTARPNLTSLVSPWPSSRARPKRCPGPDPGSRHRCVRFIPKRLQNITVFLFGLPSYFMRDRPTTIGWTE